MEIFSKAVPVEITHFVTAVRKSTASIFPPAAPLPSAKSFSIPTAFKALAFFAPQQRATASYSPRMWSAEAERPTSALKTNSTPSSFIRFMRRSIIFFSSFMFGMPYIKSPPALSSLSKTVTLCPRRLSQSATASPLGPEPITAIFFPLRVLGTSAFM